MKQYMEIGERGYYDKKRYLCAPATRLCLGCDLAAYVDTKKSLCSRVFCRSFERPDKTDVIFVLQPKYRKEVKNG